MCSSCPLRKPIKHEVKVFCLCCAYLVIILSFATYCGKDSSKIDLMTVDVDICKRLIHAADLVTVVKGKIQGRYGV